MQRCHFILLGVLVATTNYLNVFFPVIIWNRLFRAPPLTSEIFQCPTETQQNKFKQLFPSFLQRTGNTAGRGGGRKHILCKWEQLKKKKKEKQWNLTMSPALRLLGSCCVQLFPDLVCRLQNVSPDSTWTYCQMVRGWGANRDKADMVKRADWRRQNRGILSHFKTDFKFPLTSFRKTRRDPGTLDLPGYLKEFRRRQFLQLMFTIQTLKGF